MTERWQIAKMVMQGLPYRVIMEQTGASSTTISRVAHWVVYGQGGYRKACTPILQKPAPSALEFQSGALSFIDHSRDRLSRLSDGARSSIG